MADRSERRVQPEGPGLAILDRQSAKTDARVRSGVNDGHEMSRGSTWSSGANLIGSTWDAPTVAVWIWRLGIAPARPIVRDIAEQVCSCSSDHAKPPPRRHLCAPPGLSRIRVGSQAARCGR